MGFMSSLKGHLGAPRRKTTEEPVAESAEEFPQGVIPEVVAEVLEPTEDTPVEGMTNAHTPATPTVVVTPGHQVQLPSRQSTVSLSPTPAHAEFSHQPHLGEVTQEAHSASEPNGDGASLTAPVEDVTEESASLDAANPPSTRPSEARDSALVETALESDSCLLDRFRLLDFAKSKHNQPATEEAAESTMSEAKNGVEPHAGFSPQNPAPLEVENEPSPVSQPTDALEESHAAASAEETSSLPPINHEHQLEEPGFPQETSFTEDLHEEPASQPLQPVASEPILSAQTVNISADSEEARAEAIKRDLLSEEPEPKCVTISSSEQELSSAPNGGKQEEKLNKKLLRSLSKRASIKRSSKKENHVPSDGPDVTPEGLKSPGHRVPIGDKLKGMIEQVKGKVKKDPELSSYGKQLKKGELRV